MTKQQAQAILIVEANDPAHPGGRMTVSRVLDALDRAGAFPSEATEAEIAQVAGGILEYDTWLANTGRLDGRSDFHQRALRLASACRAAGLVKS